ncbi:flavin reductase family protein [Micromonospora deserti]|uniref:Flavin reductase n=1 Tax=Micromonospora deserti TaxID=2070366 RepID=A0A2W2DNN8_9ACTN|nr:flavin reductase family protein [Micromonospora deserti]PZG01368.1 flavin reductase [Micromonospora deserti]
MEYRADRPSLLVYLGTLMAEAAAQLGQLNAHSPPADLHERFLSWARAQVPGERSGGTGDGAHHEADPARRAAAGGTMFHVNQEPGAEIHHIDPFAVPAEQRSPVRRLRGRLAAPVTLWTAPGPAGLTVSSTLIAEGEPDRLLGLVDAESDLWAAAEEAGRFAVAPLGPAHRQLADRFAGLFPSPGGLFATGAWTDTPYGPVPTDAGGWAGCRLDTAREYGWGLLVEATIETVELAEETEPLLHYRGRYRQLV